MDFGSFLRQKEAREQAVASAYRPDQSTFEDPGQFDDPLDNHFPDDSGYQSYKPGNTNFDIYSHGDEGLDPRNESRNLGFQARQTPHYQEPSGYFPRGVRSGPGPFGMSQGSDIPRGMPGGLHHGVNRGLGPVGMTKGSDMPDDLHRQGAGPANQNRTLQRPDGGPNTNTQQYSDKEHHKISQSAGKITNKSDEKNRQESSPATIKEKSMIENDKPSKAFEGKPVETNKKEKKEDVEHKSSSTGHSRGLMSTLLAMSSTSEQNTSQSSSSEISSDPQAQQAAVKEEPDDAEDKSDDDDTSAQPDRHSRGLMSTLMNLMETDELKEDPLPPENNMQEDDEEIEYHAEWTEEEYIQHGVTPSMLEEANADVTSEAQDFTAVDYKEFYCKLCHVPTTSIGNFRDHLNGKSHKNAYENFKLGKPVRGSKNKRKASDNLMLSRIGQTSFLMEILDKAEDPVVGLFFITEFHSSLGIACVCNLCGVKFDKNTAQSHITGVKHRLRYLKLEYPRKYADLKSFSGKRLHLSSTVESVCHFVEKDIGRGRPQIKVYDPNVHDAPEEKVDDSDMDEDKKRLKAMAKRLVDPQVKFQNWVAYEMEKGKIKDDKDDEEMDEYPERKNRNRRNDDEEMDKYHNSDSKRREDARKYSNKHIPSIGDGPNPSRRMGDIPPFMDDDFPPPHPLGPLPPFDPRDRMLPPFLREPGRPFFGPRGPPRGPPGPPIHPMLGPPLRGAFFPPRPPFPPFPTGPPFRRDFGPPPPFPLDPRDPMRGGSPRRSISPDARYNRQRSVSPVGRMRGRSRSSSQGRERSPDRFRPELSDRRRSRSPRAMRGRSPIRIGGRSPDRLGRRSPDRLGRRSPDRLGRSPDRLGRSPDRLGRRSPNRLGRRSPDRLGRSPDRLGRRSPDRLGRRSPDRKPWDEFERARAPMMRSRIPDLPLDPDPVRRLDKLNAMREAERREREKALLARTAVIDYGHKESEKSHSKKDKWEDDILDILGGQSKNKAAPDSLALLSGTYSSDSSPSPPPKRKPLPFSKTYLEKHEEQRGQSQYDRETSKRHDRDRSRSRSRDMERGKKKRSRDSRSPDRYDATKQQSYRSRGRQSRSPEVSSRRSKREYSPPRNMASTSQPKPKLDEDSQAEAIANMLLQMTKTFGSEVNPDVALKALFKNAELTSTLLSAQKAGPSKKRSSRSSSPERRRGEDYSRRDRRPRRPSPPSRSPSPNRRMSRIAFSLGTSKSSRHKTGKSSLPSDFARGSDSDD